MSGVQPVLTNIKWRIGACVIIDVSTKLHARMSAIVDSQDAASVSIGVDGKSIKIGRFFSEIDAAKAYNEFAIKHFGEFARLNQGVSHV